MNNKAIYLIAILIAGASGAYYYFSGKSEKLNIPSKSNMMYSAEQIKAVKTDEQGQVHLRATIDSLSQDLKTTQSQMNNVRAALFKEGQQDTTFFAKTVNGYDDNQKVILSGEVVATKTTPNGDMTVVTEELTLYPKKREVTTDKAVKVDSQQIDFYSQGLTANLQTGEYEFTNIRGQYAK